METAEQELFQKFYQLDWLLRRYIMQQRRNQGPMGVPHQGQGRILSLLKIKPEISQKELAHILDIRSQSLGELLVKLERSGYIIRTPSEVDRRVMDIRLTESGRAAAEQEDEGSSRDSFFDCLNQEEQNTLSGYLDRLSKSLETQLAGEGASPFPGQRPDFRGRGPADLFNGTDGRPPFDLRGFDPRFNREAPQPPFGDPGFDPRSKDEE